MRRLGLLLLLLPMVVALLAGEGTAVAQPAADGKVIVVYVSAYNCPYCREWEAFAQPKFEKSAERKQVEFRMVKASYFSRVDEDRYWAEDIRWIRDQLKITRGTPRFIVAKDGKVLIHKFGTSSWDRDVFPLVRRLVSQKEGSSR